MSAYFHSYLCGRKAAEWLIIMKEYELVHEIQNLCRNNQMRDVFFEEVACDDPESFVRQRLKGKEVQLTVDRTGPGTMTVHTVCDGLMEKFLFTEL